MDKYTNVEKNPIQTAKKGASLIRKLRFSATITAIFGFLSVLALILLYLALTDIAHKEEDLTLEWYVAGVCLVIIGSFIVSTFIALGFLMKISWFWKRNPIK